MKYLSFLFLSFIMINFCKGQNVGIGTNTPSPNAMLDVQSTSKGILIPRMTTTQRDAMLTPTIGLQIFNLTDSTINVFNGLSWIKQNAIDSTKWSISGNANTNPLNNFIGTTDANDFVLRTNGLEGLRLKSLSPVTSTQVNPFDVLVLTNPGTVNNKWPLSASFRLGSYQSSIDAHTQLDIALGDYATPIPDRRVMSLYGNGDVNIAGVGSFGQYLKIGTDVAEGYFQNAVDGAYRALNLNNTTQGYWFQNYNGVNTTMYVGLSGAYAGKVGINTIAPENQLSVNGNADFSGNVGIGTTSTGAKLEIAGGVKISDSINIGGQMRIMSGNPGAGKVLTSDASGLASWTTPAAIGSHFIGESYGGGIVFYVYDGGQHGLIAATSDHSAAIRWYGGTNTNTRARADGVGAGLKNTSIIIANQGNVDGNSFAATVCNEYSVTVNGVTFGDWYLPSRHELNLLYLQRGVVGGFANDNYWSSSEYIISSAWAQDFSAGSTAGSQYDSGKIYPHRVRAIRAF